MDTASLTVVVSPSYLLRYLLKIAGFDLQVRCRLIYFPVVCMSLSQWPAVMLHIEIPYRTLSTAAQSDSRSICLRAHYF